MLASTLLTLSLLSLSSAATLPASVAVTVTTIISTTTSLPSSSSSPSSSTNTTTYLTPSQQRQQAARFAADYASLISAQRTNPNFLALQTATAVDRPEAARQESAYLLALKTATGDIPLPAYVTALPQDQQSYFGDLHASLAAIARADYGLAVASSSASSSAAAMSTAMATGVGNGTLPINGTGAAAGGNSTIASNGTVVLSTTAAPPAQEPSAAAPANGTNAAKGMGVGRQPAGLVKMVGAGLVGVMGIAVFL
ncbi:MAG: hypothetical protein LQ350_008175 [Teloschistes chrysophthalmus]|nr:MAG: hypothetical protein LQ350_008175 [Niorma chrysophthalma]